MIRLEHVYKQFKGKAGTVDALRDVSIHVEKGDIYGIIGFSGAGKSTLIRMVNRLERPDSGTVTVDGRQLDQLSAKELRTLRRSIGMVFQQFNLLESKTVFQNVAVPLKLEKADKGTIARRVTEILRFVELEEKRDVYVSQLSGGQKQRVGIARALATSPSILLCDEATSALDPKTTESILQLLRRVNREMGVTILLITHQMQVIQMICNKVAVMEGGQVVEKGGVMDVFSCPREEITKEFVRTVVNDRIPRPIRGILEGEERNYRLERLKFIGSSVREPVIAMICRFEGVDVNILGATVQELEDSVMCVFILQLTGPEDLLDRLEERIDEAEIIRERVGEEDE